MEPHDGASTERRARPVLSWLVAWALLLPGAIAHADEILELQISSGPRTYRPSNELWLLAWPRRALLDTGELVGFRGGGRVASTRVVSEFSEDGTLRFELSARRPNRMLEFSYSLGAGRATAGELSVGSPLVLRAEPDSTTAHLSGLVEVAYTGEPEAGPPGFVRPAAGIGTLAPFSVTIELLDGRTWASGIFETEFRYQLSGQVDYGAAQPRETLDGLLIPAFSASDMVSDRERNLLYIANGDSILRFDLESATFRSPMVLGGTLVDLDLSSDARHLVASDRAVVGDRNGIWELDLEGEAVRRIEFDLASVHEGSTQGVAYASDGSILVSSRWRGSGGSTPLRLYDPRTDEVTILLDRLGAPASVATSPDDSLLAFVDGSGRGRFGTLRALDRAFDPSGVAGSRILHLAASQAAGRIALGGRIFDLDFESVAELRRGFLPAWGAAFDRSGARLYLTFPEDSQIRAYRTSDLEPLESFPAAAWFGEGSDGRLRMSADGALIFVRVKRGVRVVRVLENAPPVADAGPDRVEPCRDASGVEIILDATGTTERDGDPLEFSWSTPAFGTLTGELAAAKLPIGEHVIALEVIDARGARDIDVLRVGVVDDEAPEITRIIASDTELWPPNGALRPVHLQVEATDRCDHSPTCTIAGVRSTDSASPGSPDWVATGDLSVNLRARRQASRGYLIYTLEVECLDESMNAATGEVQVVVPHDRRR